MRIDYLTPWNEPNHPYFISPQRKACDALSPSRAVAPYARLARAARAELAEHGGGTTARPRRDGGHPRAQRARHRRRGDDPGPAARAGVRGAGVVAARLHRRHRPGRHGQGRARDPPLPARARDLDHRDRRRPGAGRPLARARDHERGAGMPAAAPAPARLARRPARDRRRPVHDARGRPVPDRPGHHRPRARPAGAARVAGVGRARRAERAAAARRPAASARPGRAARGRAS